MNGANTGSDWAFCKNEQEGPGSHYYEASNTTGLVFFFFFLQEKVPLLENYLNLPSLTYCPLLSDISRQQELKGLGPSPLGPK